MEASNRMVGGRGPDVVVVGAGLAGLTAATVAAAAGASVLVVDRRAPGGRAAVREVAGAVLNGGPRAWFPGGPAARELRSLGLRPSGRSPRPPSASVLVGGRLHHLVGAAPALARSALALGRAGRAPGAGSTAVSEWLAALPARDRPAAAALVRLVTYADDLDRLSLDAAAAQVAVARRGVRYLHGGFGSVVELLARHAVRHGAELVRVADVRLGGVDGSGRRVVELPTGAVRARSVVLAVGTPGATGALLDEGGRPGGGDVLREVGPPSTAACLELVLRRAPARRFVLGLDEPLYLSQHGPPARLGPTGTVVVHALRYGASTAEDDRARLESLAASAGVDPGAVVHRRFLHRMVVTAAVPDPATGGLAGRAPVADPARPGLLLAGDWVGDEGMLADAAVASGARAGRLAARIDPGRGPAAPAGPGERHGAPGSPGAGRIVA